MRDETANPEFSNDPFSSTESPTGEVGKKNEPFWNRIGEQNYPLHIVLFLLTLLTTSIAGGYWVGKDFSLEDFGRIGEQVRYGFPYAFSLLLILTCHEFGHFFATMYHNVRSSLPYFIPMPPLPFLLSIGTFGAMIRMKERIPDSKSLFDIGVYGPLAGFVVALAILVYGFATVPPLEYLFQIHPEYELPYKSFGMIPENAGALRTGKNLLYWLLEQVFQKPNLPPMTEMYHYPFLFAGWLGCFVTALNLLPVGQLDGGHIIYAMFGRRVQFFVARIFLALIVLLGLPAFIEWFTVVLMLFARQPFNGFPFPIWLREISWGSWIIWALLLWRFVKLDHPPVFREQRLDSTRMIIGWMSIIIFILCFTPVPFGQTP